MLVTLNDVLPKAQRDGYAVGLFNATDSDMLDAVLNAAEALRSPVIMGTAEVLLPYGSLDLIAPGLIAAAERASVPVVVHYDHGLSFDGCISALKHGFSSIMYDGSAKSEEENLDETCEMVRIAHSFGASIEGEIGHVGLAKAGDGEDEDMYTTPEEARDFVFRTDVDALAIAIGTAHGAYKTKPKLDINRLVEIHREISTPLVLHGGSGLSDDDFRNTVRNGISKINIFTDLCVMGDVAVKRALEAGLSYLDVRNVKVRAIEQAVREKMTLFGSANRY